MIWLVVLLIIVLIATAIYRLSHPETPNNPPPRPEEPPEPEPRRKASTKPDPRLRETLIARDPGEPGAELSLKPLSGPGKALSFPLDNLPLTVGRGPGVDVSIEDDFVTGAHARFEMRDGLLLLTDLGSRNGTTVNDIRIDAPTRLLSGDVIQIGGTRLEVTRASGATGDPGRRLAD